MDKKSKYTQKKDEYIKEIKLIFPLINLETEIEKIKKSFKRSVSEEGMLFVILKRLHENG